MAKKRCIESASVFERSGIRAIRIRAIEVLLYYNPFILLKKNNLINLIKSIYLTILNYNKMYIIKALEYKKNQQWKLSDIYSQTIIITSADCLYIYDHNIR